MFFSKEFSTRLLLGWFFLCLASSSVQAAHKVEGCQKIEARDKIIEMSCAFVLSRAIHTAAKIKVADYLVDGPVKIDVLAAKTDSDPGALYRIMRFLSSHNVFKELENKTFALTELSEPLLSGSKNSVRDWLEHHDGDEKRWRAYGSMDYSVKTGRPAFDLIFKEGFFDFISKDAAASAGFDLGMKNISEGEELAIVQSHDFSDYKSIVDIGGGTGDLLVKILETASDSRATLYELAHTLDAAKQNFSTKPNLKDKIQFEEGSFFDSVPEGYDAYVLKRVLHDWNDDQCVQILKNCAKSMKRTSKLLVIDGVVPDDSRPSIIKEIDVMMMVLFGGQERSESEWRKIVKQSGLEIISVKKTQSMLSIIEIGKK